MPASTDGASASAQQLLQQGISAYGSGQAEAALARFRQALDLAAAAGDTELRDRIFCNACSVALELGEVECASTAELKRILMRTRSPETAYLAAYNAARRYELEKRWERALFYAGIARDRALQSERPDWLGYSHNLMANIQLADSSFDEACTSYQLALGLMSLEPSVARALVLDNLGYCRFVQGEHREGFAMLFECLRTLRRFSARRLESRPRLSLCFGYLEVGRLDRALEHGRRALALAEEHGDEDVVKNSRYLLGEIFTQRDDEPAAREHFEWLQRHYYPEAPHLTDLLLAVDVRNLINFKA